MIIPMMKNLYFFFNIPRVSASKQSINLEYAPYLRNYILQPLVNDGSDGAKTALERLHGYDLLREDLDSLSEICTWSNSADPMAKVESKVGSRNFFLEVQFSKM